MGFVVVKCPNCGAEVNLDESRDFGFCSYCGTKVVQDKIIVEHTGSIRVDRSERLNNLYILARRARDDNNSEKAAQYYDQVLQEDPNSWEANFYSVYFQSMNCKIGEIESAAIRMINCEDTILKLINESVTDLNEKKAALVDVSKRLLNISTILYKSALDNYFGISESIRNNYTQEMLNRCGAAFRISYCFGDHIVAFWGDLYAKEIAVPCWKDGITGHMQLMPYYANKKANKRIISAYAEKIRKYEPHYSVPAIKIKQKKKGCYIATCVYGSYNCPQVWTLRRFRDNTLAASWYGRVFIRAYYFFSPILVAWFGHTYWFKWFWRRKLDKMVNTLQKNGVDDSPYEDQKW